MRLEFSRFVETDLEAIADFIAEDSPERAIRFIREIWHAILKIGEQPYLYQLRPGNRRRSPARGCRSICCPFPRCWRCGPH